MKNTIEGCYAMQNVKHKRNDKLHLIIFKIISMKNNQTLVSNADLEIPTLGSTDNAGNLVNLVFGIIR